MLAAALDLAGQGWEILPCRESGERAKAPYGGLVPHGKDDATTDPDLIRSWWRRRPNAMIGARVPDTLVVLDLDPRHGGTLEALQRVTGPLPQTLTVWSGRNDGGRHLYFLRPRGALAQTRLPAGVDLRDAGKHYLLMPPSLHPATGLPYRWETRPPARLPAAVVAALEPRARRPLPTARTSPPGKFSGLIHSVARSGPGTRNDTLFWAACRAVEEDAPASILDQLREAAATAGLTDREAAGTINSARRRMETTQ